MGPGWAKKVEIIDGSGVDKKSWNFWWVRGGPQKLKFVMGPGWAKKLKFLMGPGWAKKVEIFDGSGVG